jgi:hypothetical protein
MVRDDDGEESESLEVIDLQYEVETARMTSHPRRMFSRSSLAVGAVVIVGVAALIVAVVAHDQKEHATRRQADTSTSQAPTTGDAILPSPQTSVSIQRPHGPILGRYYPVLDHTDTATLVLPSGRTLTLTGGLKSLIGGLGATFGGSVTAPTQTCCSADQVTFEIFRAAPSDLFQTPHAGAVSTPLLMAPAQAKVGEDGLQGSEYRLGILSTGDWTLVVFFLNYDDVVATDLLHGWHLHSTPDGAVLNVPATNAIADEYVMLGRTPDLTDREIMLAEHGCPTGSTKAQTLGEYATHAGWCLPRSPHPLAPIQQRHPTRPSPRMAR